MLDIAMTLSIAACAQPVVGGWNEARGGAFSLVDGEETDGLRQDILDMGFELVGTETLTPEFLGGVDTFVLIVITTGNTAITALTGPEQEAMLDFVDAGGVLLAFLDNDTFAGQLGDDAITSILDPFGLSADGTIIGGPHLVTIADPTSTPVTDGPCGIIESFPTFFPGWFDAVGDSTPLGTLRNGQVGLTWFAPGEVGAGAVVFVSDSSLLGDVFYANEDTKRLVCNSLHLGGCPADVNGDGVLNILDFVAFQGLFQAMDPGADCDGNGMFNILDFVCYQTLFQAGC